MTLEQEIQQLLRDTVSESPAVQRAFIAHGQDEGTVGVNEGETNQLFALNIAALRAAVLRLAREIDQLGPTGAIEDDPEHD